MIKKIKEIIFPLLIIIAFFINNNLIYKNMTKINYPFTINIFLIGIIYIILYFIYKKSENKKIYKLNILLSILFSIFLIIGNSYIKLNNWNLVFGNFLMFSISIIQLIGYTIFFNTIFKFFNHYIENIKIKEISFKNEKINKILNIINEKPFITSFIIMIICWLPYIIAFYPIILSPDPSFQIRQFFNVHTKYADWVIQLDPNVFMTNHHPVLHTLLLGGCLKLGRFLINDNFGLFLFSFIQIILQSSVLAYTIKFLKKHNIQLKTRLLILLIYCLVPMFPFYAMSGVKDTIYTNLIIIYLMFIYTIITEYKDKKISIGLILGLLVNVILIALFRNNGIYVLVLSLPVVIIYCRKNLIPLLIVLIILIGGYQTYNKVILPYFKISSGSIREMLSIPFQQTARDIRDNEKKYTTKEKQLIDKMLNYDTIASRYKPEISDPVKNEFNKDTTSEELKEYFKIWFNHLLKNPNTYVEATLNNIYGYFNPTSTNWYIYYRFDKRITENNLVNYSYNDLKDTRDVLSSYGKGFPYIPIIGLISNIGFNTWLLFIMFIYSIIKNKKEFIIMLLPGLITLLICIASPVNTYFRYAMPYIFGMPLLITLFIKEIGGFSNARQENSGINTML